MIRSRVFCSPYHCCSPSTLNKARKSIQVETCCKIPTSWLNLLIRESQVVWISKRCFQYSALYHCSSNSVTFLPCCSTQVKYFKLWILHHHQNEFRSQQPTCAFSCKIALVNQFRSFAENYTENLQRHVLLYTGLAFPQVPLILTTTRINVAVHKFGHLI